MPRIPSRLLSATALAALLGLAACGGGGGGASSGGTGGTGGGGTGGSGTLGCVYPTSLSPAMRTALDSGNALGGPTADEFMDAALGTLETQRTTYDGLIRKLYNLNSDGSVKSDGSSLTSLNWDPTHDAALLTATFGANTEVLLSTDTTSGAAAPAKGLAVAGETSGHARYLVMASNPFRTTVNAQMDQFMVNAVQWLTGKAPGSPFKAVLLQLDESYYFKDESSTRTWLTAKFGANVTYNAANACDGTSFASCLTTGADLVIVSQQYDTATQSPLQIRDAIKSAMDQGRPVLYLQRDGGPNLLGTQLLDLFQVGYAGDNYWSNLRANAFDGRTLLGRLSPAMTAIRELLTRLKSGTYDFGLGTWQASTTEAAAYTAQFKTGADAVRDMMQSLDASGRDLFTTCGNEVPKLLALLGDRLRQDIVYPMTTAATPIKAFLRAYYADHAVYTSRRINPAQKDLGSFSRTDFKAVTPVTRTVSMVSRTSFKSTGAYALPGRTVTVTRLDANAVGTSIFVNTLRSGSTHEWEDGTFGGYGRPKFIKSAAIPLAQGASITFTHPYGGPIQVAFTDKDVPVQLRFENVGEHAHWAGTGDDATFATQLAANAFDWTEVATDGFVMHSKLDRFKAQTLADPHWNTPALLGAAVKRYTHSFTRVLAGFQGDGVDQEPEVYGWAVGKGLPVPSSDKVLHMNADQATCGWGCSGNPYDAGWAFSPIGHGDLHELGHSLQIPRFQLTHGAYTYPNHAGTNFYAYYSQSRFYDDTGVHPDCQGHPFKTLYAQLQAAYRGGDRTGAFSTAMDTYFAAAMAPGGDSGIHNSYALYTQVMMMARAKGALTNGHHMMGRIHAVDRAFKAALASQATWDAAKATFGFALVPYAEAQTLSNNDFMAIAIAFTTGLDFRDYLAMWGLKVGATAQAQIAAFGFPVVERAFFALNDTQWVDGALSTRVAAFPKLPVDGVTAWPLP